MDGEDEEDLGGSLEEMALISDCRLAIDEPYPSSTGEDSWRILLESNDDVKK